MSLPYTIVKLPRTVKLTVPDAETVRGWTTSALSPDAIVTLVFNVSS